MYNFDSNPTYNDTPEEEKNLQYQKDILNAFNLSDNINFEQLSKIQEKLYEDFKDNEKVIKLIDFYENNQSQFPFKIPKQTYFVLLFQFDFFFAFHKCLQDLHLTNKISEKNYNNLIFLIKKNNQ